MSRELIKSRFYTYKAAPRFAFEILRYDKVDFLERPFPGNILKLGYIAFFERDDVSWYYGELGECYIKAIYASKI